MAGFGPQIKLCQPAARRAALEVLYSRVPESLRHQLIVEVLDEAARGEIDLSGLWVAQARAGRLMGALLTQPLAGKAAAVWAPEVVPSWRRAKLAATLVQTALLDLKARGFRLAQAVLDESASPQAAADLSRGGMPRVTELLYLERETALDLDLQLSLTDRSTFLPSLSAKSPFHWCSFSPLMEADFQKVLQETYVGSLDMPELDRARALEDIMASHRAAGRFVADRWRLGQIPGQPEAAAVLLLAELPRRDSWEVVYLGLTPVARGRGLGRFVVAHALELAREHVPRLELAVDCRNKPAVRLYESTGFKPRDRRAVHLALLGEGSA